LDVNPSYDLLAWLAKAARGSDSASWTQLAKTADRRLHRAMQSRFQRERVRAVKVLVALLPESWAIVQRWLRAGAEPRTHEVLFTLFCFLDDIPSEPRTKALRGTVLKLVEDFLIQVRKDPKLAAWMAGDLLGDHWELQESLPILFRVAKGARFVAGRKAALHGLAHALSRTKGSSRSRIRRVLAEVQEADRSGTVRQESEFILSGRDLCARSGTRT
jgi:hypothetical protein